MLQRIYAILAQNFCHCGTKFLWFVEVMVVKLHSEGESYKDIGKKAGIGDEEDVRKMVGELQIKGALPHPPAPPKKSTPKKSRHSHSNNSPRFKCVCCICLNQQPFVLVLQD